MVEVVGEAENTEKKKKVVAVFCANGGIGNETVKDLVAEMERTGEEIEIRLLARDKNVILGLTGEILEAYPNANLDLSYLLRDENHYQWNPKDISSAKEALAGVDKVLIPGGTPRKQKTDGTYPDRSELIGLNTDMITPMAQAVAEFAPRGTEVLLLTNPVGNAVTGVQAKITEVYIEQGVLESDLPKYQVKGMGGTLDQSRFRNFIAKELNERLELKGKDRILPKDVAARVYGAHSDFMVPDFASIEIDHKGKTFSFDGILAKYERNT
ncbi:MAG: hypothetical protein WCJ33_06965, partial [Pseudomonadota bacterium]